MIALWKLHQWLVRAGHEDLLELQFSTYGQVGVYAKLRKFAAKQKLTSSCASLTDGTVLATPNQQTESNQIRKEKNSGIDNYIQGLKTCKTNDSIAI